MANNKTIYIYMDDSGHVEPNDDFSVYGGIAFTDKKVKTHFNGEYVRMLDRIKSNLKKEGRPIPSELKSVNIRNSDKKKLLSLCKDHIKYAVIVNNKSLPEEIIGDSTERVKYTFYIQKCIIKEIVKYCIEQEIISANDNVSIVIGIDEPALDTSKFDLKKDLDQELLKGGDDYDDPIYQEPIIKGGVNLSLQYLDSKKSKYIQASDLIVGEVRSIIKEGVDSSEKMNQFLTIKKVYPAGETIMKIEPEVVKKPKKVKKKKKTKTQITRKNSLAEAKTNTKVRSYHRIQILAIGRFKLFELDIIKREEE